MQIDGSMRFESAIRMVAYEWFDSIPSSPYCLYYLNDIGGSVMKRTVEMMNARIHMLQERDPVVNANIIRKLKRQIRKALR